MSRSHPECSAPLDLSVAADVLTRQEPDEEEDEEEDKGNGKEDGDDEDDTNDDGYSERARIVTGSADTKGARPTCASGWHRSFSETFSTAKGLQK
jgi:hypothetical protein